MHCYETIYILHPDLGDEAVATARGKVTDLIDKGKGRLYRRENWGKKRLAYNIAKQTKGNYQLIRYVGDAGIMSTMERVFRLDEAYLKFLTIKLDIDPESVKDEEPADEIVAAAPEADKKSAAGAKPAADKKPEAEAKPAADVKETASDKKEEAPGKDAEAVTEKPAEEPVAEEAKAEPAATGE